MTSPVPNSEATQFKRGEEQVEIARKGGIASGKAKREKKTMKELLKTMLEEEAKITIEGVPKGMTYKELATLGLIKGSIYGNSQNYKTIMETIGEEIDSANAPILKIEVVNNKELEKNLYEADRLSENDNE